MPRKKASPAPRKGFIKTIVEVEGRTETRVVEIPAFEPTPWGPDTALETVGTRAVRVDAGEKVTGQAKYTADIARPGMLHAIILRSWVARGTLVSVDVDAARKIRGVIDVIGPGDAPAKTRLFPRKVTYAGQPIAAVCAESLHAVTAGIRALRAKIETAPFAATFEAATAPDAPLVRSKGNVAEGSPVVNARGNLARGLARADVVIEREYRTPVQLHSAIEPHGAVAEWQGDQLVVWESTQGIFRTREQLAEGLELPQSRVRVIKQYMGGGFGAKNGAGPHTFVAAIFARRTGRPVRCVNSRKAEQSDSGNRPATTQRVTIGAKRNGTLTAISLSADIPLGVGGWEGGPGQLYHELYACPNVRTEETFAYVNASAMQAFRAPGYAEGAFALEGAINALAAKLGMDPLALRRRNYAKTDPRKKRPWSGNALLECYEQAAARFGWDTRDSRRGPAASRAQVRRGFGMAAQIWPTGGGPPAYAHVRINADASIDLLTGTQDLGTGARTILSQVVADAMGARLSDVHTVIGDTGSLPYTGNSWGSMTTPSVAPAARMAAEDARRMLLDAAAPMLGVPLGKLETRNSTVCVRGTDRSMTFAEVTKELGDVMIIGRGTRGPNPLDVSVATFGAQFAEVEVDTRTGVVRVVRIVAAHDAGRILNPTLAESQLEGGIIQGLGYGMFEERVLDPATGLQLNPDLHDYRIPTIADTPVIDAFCVGQADAAANHTGARGLAEPPIIPTAPAIAAAVADAIGAELHEIPLTPWRVLAAAGEV